MEYETDHFSIKKVGVCWRMVLNIEIEHHKQAKHVITAGGVEEDMIMVSTKSEFIEKGAKNG